MKLKIHGIDYMNDDPSQINVLYAKVTPLENSELFQDFIDELIEYFVKTGITFDLYKLS